MSFINDTYSIKENSFKENTGYKFEKIVYTTVKHKKNDPSVDGFQKIGRALDHFQLAFGAISESSEKKIKNNQNFIKLEDFIQSIPEKVSEKLFDQYFLNKSLINELKYFKPFADQINDPIVKDFILRTQTIQDLNIPSETIELLLNNSPDLEKIREEAKERSERLRSRYPILWDSYIYNMLGQYNKESAKKAAEEMIFYMNSKLRDLNE
jgi:hypothetical protein